MKSIARGSSTGNRGFRRSPGYRRSLCYLDRRKGKVDIMSWQPELDEIKRRIQLAEQMGGEDNIKRQHDGGKLTVRERVDRLLDNDSFHEYGALAGSTKYDEQGRL